MSFDYPQYKNSSLVDRAKGMPCQIVRLRDAGRKITRAEYDAQEPLTGLLVTGDWTGGNVWHRSLHYASLKEPQGYGNELCLPLYEPKIIKWDSRGIVLAGFESHIVDGMLNERGQVWIVRPVQSQG